MITVPLDGSIVRGAAELEATPRGIRPHRLPAHVRTRFPEPQLLGVEAQPAGVRVAFRTPATCVELVLHATRATILGVGRARGCVDVRIDGELHTSAELVGGDVTDTDPRTGQTTLAEGAPQSVVLEGLDASDKLVEIWLPHTETVDLLALHADAPVVPDARERRRWVHHGSSISQGSNATRPSGTWPAIAAHRGDVELRNLGFGGSAMADPFLARVIRDAPADLISVALGINVVNADAMRRRAFVPAVHGFLDTIRDGHPDTPLVLITAIHCAIHEKTPGPGAIDPEAFATGTLRFTASGTEGDTALGRLTLEVVRDALREVFALRDDPNLHLLDGLELYGETDAALMPLPDGLHPGADAHELIGERFAARVFDVGGAFAADA
ncbi:GDSL-type esterase/lipase family protein [Microbacterium sp. 179-B 1A2 NHS]|uniref:GDSL-type esterase/lipase family protein n=1 Tax=Microbacterium sp. 179-B 1A2 NHS TaxID=3142383 RepID=UPI0039A14AF9